jgi:hypothetical protein
VVVKDEVTRSGPHSNLLSVRNMLLEAFKKKLLHRLSLSFGEEHLKMLRNISNLTKAYN